MVVWDPNERHRWIFLYVSEGMFINFQNTIKLEVNLVRSTRTWSTNMNHLSVRTSISEVFPFLLQIPVHIHVVVNKKFGLTFENALHYEGNQGTTSLTPSKPVRRRVTSQDFLIDSMILSL